MSRLLIVSNRLPVTVKLEGNRVSAAPSSGGLATGLRGPHERSGGLWIGWPGDVTRLSPEQRAELEASLAAQRTVPIYLTTGEVARYYEGYANGVLWPLFHYLLERIPLESADWEPYRRVNERFADAVEARYRDGDIIWVHDYQLMLLPALLRRRLPRARIGFFLHIPFPSDEIFRTLPQRSALLEGLLGADLIGFHTLSYVRHFASSLSQVLGLEADVDRLWYGGREIRLGAWPMGIDANEFAALGDAPEVTQEAERLRHAMKEPHLFLGIDRLDYTKGIPRRLLTMERMLEREPALRGKVRLLQLSVPSRDKVVAYQEYRREVEQLAGRINGAHATVDSVPIHYLYRSVSAKQLAALYRAADVMLVTPLRDGMNLVAKEFVATRTDEDGVLVLSELAGAASELGEALRVNPYDLDHTAATIRRAMTMPREERRARMRALRQRVATWDVHRWAESYLEALESTRDGERISVQIDTPSDQLESLIADLRAAPRLVLLLDYDGTLVRFAGEPEGAAPDKDLRALLGRLAARPATEVHVLGGRTVETFERWLGDLPVGLHAEQGYWSRASAGDPWRALQAYEVDWQGRALPLMESFAARTPGSAVERKSTGLAWHYRQADPSFAALQAKELRLHLDTMLRSTPAEVVQGPKVVEARLPGRKAQCASLLMAAHASDPSARIMAIGDDRSDEELFAAVPPPGLTVHVGEGPSCAAYRLPDPAAVRALLTALL